MTTRQGIQYKHEKMYLQLDKKKDVFIMLTKRLKQWDFLMNDFNFVYK